MKTTIINYLHKIFNVLNNNKFSLLLVVPFLILDLVTRFMGFKIDFFPIYMPQPLLFSIIWSGLFIGIMHSLKPLAGKIFIWIMFIISFILFLTNVIYYSLTDLYFGFNLLMLADEGSSYIMETIMGTNPIIYAVALVALVLCIALIIYCLRRIDISSKFEWKKFLLTICIFIIAHLLMPLTFGRANSALKWSSFKNPKNVYIEFTDVNKSMKISGIYEYTVRNFYVNFLRPKEKISDKDKKFLDDAYNQKKTNKNKYTGMFKDKNLIILQLEGMDKWLLSKKNTPNLFKLKSDSIDMSTNHFSLYTGGGSTFNSEFAVNTGYTTPTTFIENVYNLNKNMYDTTLPKCFKQIGYDVNSYHMNTADFYSRRLNYKSWGYDDYISLKEEIKYKDDLEYTLDRNLLLCTKFKNLMFDHKNKFVDYIISFSPHTPFNTTQGTGKILVEKNYKNNVPDMDEEQVAKMMAKETDYMVGLLMDELKARNLYDNTVIVAFADHYLYTIKNKAILDKYKITSDNRINNTPLFIWSSETDHTIVKKVNMQMDILPTILNLFGINYNPSHINGEDILDGKPGLAYFSDYSWYDGNTYVAGGNIVDGKKVSKKYISEISTKVKTLIDKNDLTLKYNYWKLAKND